MKLAHCTDDTREAIPTQLAQFADGEPCVDDVQGPPLELGPTGGPSSISHRFGQYEVGFDKVGFAGRESFQEILDEHNLPDQPIVIDTSPSRADIFEYGAYVWCNSKLLLVSKYNPLTGKAVKMYDCQTVKPGRAHYIGLEGERTPVEELANTISRRSQHADRADGERRYI
jgi:hypothetical protein